MRFRDIPQFTRVGSWECDYDLERFVKAIEEFENEGLQMNPDFQRGHVWDEAQQVAYIEYLLKGGKTARVIYLNCVGWQNGVYGEDFVCVDGLQRATAIKRFIHNEIKVFGAYFKEYEDSPRMTQGVKININDLSTRKEVLQWYIDFNTGGTVHTSEEIERVRRLLDVESK
ncbi:DUF262 domain-containing protein [Paenibacillus polymyxa]|uniref:DUF262 domain-containing protein n=1 Tax=Paenibacillus polymyxa TaxID=1406 RepID=UPI002AB572A8|nr:DUF262 domain-containing protein [Paenibacillus polymyxa]MDY8021194.1 DUF262 domain-containing protein [Paenibacillus polymyxa]